MKVDACIAFTMSARLLPLLLAAVASAEDASAAAPPMSPCQKCCSPGGDCSKAYKQAPGKCCGTFDGRAFCCPYGTASDGTSAAAKCYNCGNSYRCYTGTASRSICGYVAPSSHHHVSRHHYDGFDGSRGGGGGDLFGSILFFLLVAACFYYSCTPRQPPIDHSTIVYDQFGKPILTGGGVPQGMPVMANGGVPYPAMAGYPGGYGGYSGYSVAGSAATGFLGGMMVNEMMHAPHHSYSDYGDGGDYGGGGDFGGGDGGFAADS